MPKLTVDGFGTFEVPEDKRLVQALSEDAGVDQLHACGGVARCTTCRVEFIAGRPERMTQAEKAIRQTKGILDPTIRLSCQMLCDHDMHVKAISRLEFSGRKDQGKPVAPHIEPPPVWTKQ